MGEDDKDKVYCRNCSEDMTRREYILSSKICPKCRETNFASSGINERECDYCGETTPPNSNLCTKCIKKADRILHQ